MIYATVHIKRIGSVAVEEAVGLSVQRIHASYEQLYSDDDEIVVIDVMVQK